MVGARRPELTEGQADCLRLVNAHYTSKQIARQLNISPFTVDQRLDAARKKLSAENRIDAARRFALLEKEEIYQPLVYDPPGLEKPQFALHSNVALSGNGALQRQFETDHIPEKSNEHVANSGLEKSSLSWLVPPPFGGRRHNLSSGDIVLKAINVAFASTMGIAAVVIVITGLMRLFD